MKKIILHIGLLCLCFLPSTVFGAEFYFEQTAQNTSTGEHQIVLKLKTSADAINAVSGKIEVPDGLEIVKIHTGSSAVLIWIDQPRPGRVVTFSGITPGGFQGDVKLFSLGYSNRESFTGKLKVTEGEVIKNDGLGSPVANTSTPFTFSKPNIQSTLADIKDVNPPEDFTIVLGRDPGVFNGAYFASFMAQDKKTGVERYEWAHTLFFSPTAGDWRESVSPLVLTKSQYIQRIFVKAIDGEGNIRISTLNGPYRYAVSWIGIIIMLTICALFFFVRRYSYQSS